MDRISKDFGINKQCMAILEMVDGDEFDSAGIITTRPWYNGREKGVVISVSKNFQNKPNNCLHLAFFEHRNSDSICFLKWFTDSDYWNHPIEDKDIFAKAYKGDSKYDVAKTFGYGEIGDAAAYLIEEIEGFLA